jgi:CubicO group peptidase (beta-lactamase class C family)
MVASGVPALYPGAVALVVRSGIANAPVVAGAAVRYSSYDAELPIAERVPMRADTIFDIASLTKLFTATVVLSLVDDGALSLSDKASVWLSELDDRITVRQLLTHTSGLPGHIESWKSTDSRRAVLTAPSIGAPGTVFEYSCLGYISAGWIAESVAGKPLAELVTERVCRPLGLSDTGYWPSAVDRVAATEYEPDVARGMVRGSVHDENSWWLGGGVGNAGIFSTAADLGRFGEMLRLGGAPVLSDAAHAEMTTDQLPAALDPGYRQGIGPRIDDPSFMGSLAGSGAIGHTGFTGTSLVVDRDRELVIVFLTNRVHPSRDRSSVVEIRQQLADACR